MVDKLELIDLKLKEPKELIGLFKSITFCYATTSHRVGKLRSAKRQKLESSNLRE